MNRHVTELEFERDLADIRTTLERLEKAEAKGGPDVVAQANKVRASYDQALTEIYRDLTPWQRVLISRHPQRPRFLDYVATLFPDFIELHGDRHFGDDGAIVGGLATFADRSVMLVGEQKGRSTKENITRNFGMPHPEGYRKAERLMRTAGKFDLPIISFIDTSGASALQDDEARGVSWAIAECLKTQADLHVPIIAVVISEGMSGGAIAIAMGNRVLMLEHAVYSVIAPEACASQLWRDVSAAPEAAAAMQVSASQLLQLGLIDRVIPEPIGGAHRDPEVAAQYVQAALREEFSLLANEGINWTAHRYEHYRHLGRMELLMDGSQTTGNGRH